MKPFSLLPQSATSTQRAVHSRVAGWVPGSQVGSKLGSRLKIAVSGLVMRKRQDWVAGVATYCKTNPKKVVPRQQLRAKKAYRNNNRDNLLHLLPRGPQWGAV